DAKPAGEGRERQCLRIYLSPGIAGRWLDCTYDPGLHPGNNDCAERKPSCAVVDVGYHSFCLSDSVAKRPADRDTTKRAYRCNQASASADYDAANIRAELYSLVVFSKPDFVCARGNGVMRRNHSQGRTGNDLDAGYGFRFSVRADVLDLLDSRLAGGAH